jgi:hypothetical protein
MKHRTVGIVDGYMPPCPASNRISRADLLSAIAFRRATFTQTQVHKHIGTSSTPLTNAGGG